jgi:hypothetical protein
MKNIFKYGLTAVAINSISKQTLAANQIEYRIVNATTYKDDFRTMTIINHNILSQMQ